MTTNNTHKTDQEWIEELKRQCEIRNLPFSDVLYLVKEVLLTQKNKEIEEAEEKVKREIQEAIDILKMSEEYDIHTRDILTMSTTELVEHKNTSFNLGLQAVKSLLKSNQ